MRAKARAANDLRRASEVAPSAFRASMIRPMLIESTATATWPWFLLPERIMAGPPMSMFSMAASKPPPDSTVFSKG
ncbi:hypothetical protein D3C77_559930 [compost metagenome]